MKNTVLLDAISAEDKAKIESYIYKFGVIKDNFIGIEKWLQFWSYSNQKLFKLLGNQLIYKIDIAYEKDHSTIFTEIQNKLVAHPFMIAYDNFFYNVIRKYFKEGIIDSDTKRNFHKLIECITLTDDVVKNSIKIKKPGCKKMLQIQAGMKPIRAIFKVISYFKEDYNFNQSEFEDFRIKHSMVLNDKVVKGRMCFSIHPLDFMTMSDNANDWSSCMSWKTEGCYHLGTVEMMNSNNVICCYIESDIPFSWEDPESGEIQNWNSKKFRVLAYVTKDIIVNGKSYPFQNIDINKIVISTLRDLAKKNLNWSYSFGPEIYKDMIHINYASDIERNKEWIHRNKTTKHNIIFDTNAMYNDIFNDNGREYWCYRNKVKRNKVINLSGKANCLCCNNDVKCYSDNYDYNERFTNCDSVICSDCQDEINCDCCRVENPTLKKYKVAFRYKNGYIVNKNFCSNCWERYIKICPDCGKPYFTNWNSYFNTGNVIKKFGEIVSQEYPEDKLYYLRAEDGYAYKTREDLIAYWYLKKKMYDDNDDPILYVECLGLHNCGSCKNYLSTIEEKLVIVTKSWTKIGQPIHLLPEEEVSSKYGFHNLKTPKWKPGFTFDMEN